VIAEIRARASTLPRDADGVPPDHQTRRLGPPLERRFSGPLPRVSHRGGRRRDKHGTDVAVLAVGEIIAIIDWFVLVSASNTRPDPHHRRRGAAGHCAPSTSPKPIGVGGTQRRHLVLLDYGDVVVHVFVDETRAYYDLDRLWADGPRVDWDVAPSAGAAERS